MVLYQRFNAEVLDFLIISTEQNPNWDTVRYRTNDVIISVQKTQKENLPIILSY